MRIQRTRTVKFTAARAAEELLNWLYPAQTPVCIVCQRALPNGSAQQSHAASDEYPPGICLFCLTGQPCDTKYPLAGQVSIDERTFQVICAAKYEGWLRDALRHWKYDGALGLTDWFARRIASSLPYFGEVQWDCIIPVPTAVDRFQKRGYDHVGILAKHLSRLVRLPLKPALQRMSSGTSDNIHAEARNYTQSQTTRSASERARALTGQFIVAPSSVDLRGKNVLLVDDVVTTGATMQACGRLLANQNVNNMFAVAIAHVQ